MLNCISYLLILATDMQFKLNYDDTITDMAW